MYVDNDRKIHMDIELIWDFLNVYGRGGVKKTLEKHAQINDREFSTNGVVNEAIMYAMINGRELRFNPSASRIYYSKYFDGRKEIYSIPKGVKLIRSKSQPKLEYEEESEEFKFQPSLGEEAYFEFGLWEQLDEIDQAITDFITLHASLDLEQEEDVYFSDESRRMVLYQMDEVLEIFNIYCTDIFEKSGNSQSGRELIDPEAYNSMAYMQKVKHHFEVIQFPSIYEMLNVFYENYGEERGLRLYLKPLIK